MSPTHRAFAALLAIGILAAFALLSTLKPDPRGHGTHEQTGLPPCAWAISTGWPCPSCGMTTAAAQAGHGDLMGSAVTHPFAALCMVLGSAMFWGAVHVAVFGSRVGLWAGRLLQPRGMTVMAGLWMLAWGYKAAVWHQ